MRKSTLNLKSLRLLPSGSRLSFFQSSSSTTSLSSTLTSSSSSSANSIPSNTSPGRRPVPSQVLTISALAHIPISPSPSPPPLESEEDQRLQLHLTQMDSPAVGSSSLAGASSMSAASAAAAIAAAAAALEGGISSSASDHHLNRHSTMSAVESTYSYDTASSPPGSPVFSPAPSVVSRASTFYYTDQFGIPGQATTTTAIPINLIFSRQRRRAAPNFRSRFPVRVRGESL